MSVGKRPPVYFRDGDLPKRYALLSKADWADAFCDLYRQCMGEEAPAEAIMADAEHRISNLRIQGIR